MDGAVIIRKMFYLRVCKLQMFSIESDTNIQRNKNTNFYFLTVKYSAFAT